MEKYLEQKRFNLISEFKRIEASYNNKVPSEIGQKHEKVFRKFLNDIFPYYDSFKGTVFGKSCDFVLADKNFHPRFEAEDDDQYYDVVTSLVDTVIELKGIIQKNEIEKGLEQCKQIKSYSKKFPLSDSINFLRMDDTFLGSWMYVFLIYHALIFRKGNYEVLITYLEKKFNSIETIEEKIIEFFKLPDVIFVVETNVLLLKNWKFFCYHEEIEKGVFLLVKKIEEFKKIYLFNTKLVAFRNILNKHFVDNWHKCWFIDIKLVLWAKINNWREIIKKVNEYKQIYELLGINGHYDD